MCRTIERPPFAYLVLDPEKKIACKVSWEDYYWALSWKWAVVYNSTGKKAYASRSTRLHGAKGKQTRVYLHKEIMKRTGLKAKGKEYTIADHLDGDSLNNTRENLRWANKAMNARNNPTKRNRTDEESLA